MKVSSNKQGYLPKLKPIIFKAYLLNIFVNYVIFQKSKTPK